MLYCKAKSKNEEFRKQSSIMAAICGGNKQAKRRLETVPCMALLGLHIFIPANINAKTWTSEANTFISVAMSIN
jgi:hypothetical protein